MHCSKYFQTFISIWDYLSVMSFGAIDFIMFIGRFNTQKHIHSHISHASSFLSKKKRRCVQMHNLQSSSGESYTLVQIKHTLRWMKLSSSWSSSLVFFFFSFLLPKWAQKLCTVFGGGVQVAASKCSNSLSAISFVFFFCYPFVFLSDFVGFFFFKLNAIKCTMS